MLGNTLKALLTMAVLVISSLSFAADIQVPNHSEPYRLVKATTKTEGVGYAWWVMGPEGFADTQVFDVGDGTKGVVFTGPPGRYAVLLVVSREGGQLDQGQTVVIIGAVTPPGPIPPVPPGPIPPNPPVPPVPPSPPSPIPAEGFRVLFLTETAGGLTEEQEAIFTNPEVYQYLTSKTAKDPNGQPSWRIWDDDYTEAQMANVPVYFKTAYLNAVKQKQDNQLWIVLGNGTSGESVPLPKNAQETLTLLKKYGG